MGRPFSRVRERPTCEYGRCKAPAASRGLCTVHYERRRLGRSMDGPKRRPSGEWTAWKIADDGYVERRRYVRGRTEVQFEHRVVMEHVLGRPLLPGETVHHRNGVRDDNHPSNLELWVTYQPAGQRPADLVEWAREILRRYD